MMRLWIKHTVTLGVILLLLGCQGRLRTRPDADAATASDVPNAAAFYYFSAAQMKLKQGDVNEATWLLEKAIEEDQHSIYLKLELANLLLIKKDTIQALEVIDQALALDAGNVQALMLVGRIRQQRQEYDAARVAFEKVLARDPSQQDAYLFLGRIYWNANDLVNARRVFQKMAQQFPDSYAAYYFYGKICSAQGNFKEAETAYLKSLALEPSLEEPRWELIKLYQDQQRDAEVTRLYQDILKNDPQNYKAVMELALHWRRLGQADQGTKLLSELSSGSGDDNGIVSTLYELYLEPKQYETAAWLLEGLIAGAPQNSDLQYLAAVAADGLKRPHEALEHLGKVAHESRFYNNAVVHSALLYHDMGKLDRAIAVIQAALSKDPKNADYYLYLGTFYEELERFDEAAAALLQGIRSDAKNVRLHFRLGVVYDKMGRKQDSIASMKAVVHLKPDDAEALNYLGYTYAEMGINLDEAEKLIQQALKIKPQDGYITDSLGWVYYKSGRFGEALKWLIKAVELIPNDPVILEHLGDAYLKVDSKDKALQCYHRSLEQNSKDREALVQKMRALETPDRQ